MTRRRAAACLAVLALTACASPRTASGPTPTATPTASSSPTPSPAAAPGRPGPDRHYPVVRTGDPRLPDHTLLHPAGPVPFALPVVVWGNGGCRQTNEEYRVFLTGLAAEGFLVVANGAPDSPFVPGRPEPAIERPQAMTAALDWAVAESTRPGGAFRGRIDTGRMVLMGQSCGASEALTASADPRVRTTVAWNNGGDSSRLHAPALFVTGGPDDDTGGSTRRVFRKARVPAVLVDKSDGGHIGLWNDAALRPAALRLADRWLAFTLYGDPEGRAFFLGADCELCTSPTWTVTARNWR